MPLTAELGKIQSRPVRHIGNSFTGIDVSHYQGYIDWKQVAADNRVGFVYLKATENVGLVDNTYRRNLEGARAEGIPVGVYHFFNSMSAAAAQLQNFCSVVDPRTQDLESRSWFRFLPNRRPGTCSSHASGHSPWLSSRLG